MTRKAEFVSPESETIELGATSALVIFISLLLSAVLGASLEYLTRYIFYGVRFTIAAVESGRHASGNGDGDTGSQADDAKDRQPAGHFISSRLRDLHRHLRAQAGMFGLVRGIGYNLIRSWIWSRAQSIVRVIVPGILREVLVVRILTNLVTAQLNTAWTHIVVSKPRNVFWYKRLPLSTAQTIHTMWLPIVAMTFVQHLDTLISERMQSLLEPGKDESFEGVSSAISGLSLILGRCLGQLGFRLIFLVPAAIVLTRVRASCLPSDDEPIVPFDRSFGAGDSPTSRQPASDPQPITATQAIRSIDLPTYKRLAKVYLEYWLAETVAVEILRMILVAQFFAFFGSVMALSAFKLSRNMPLNSEEQILVDRFIEQTGADVPMRSMEGSSFAYTDDL